MLRIHSNAALFSQEYLQNMSFMSNFVFTSQCYISPKCVYFAVYVCCASKDRIQAAPLIYWCYHHMVGVKIEGLQMSGNCTVLVYPFHLSTRSLLPFFSNVDVVLLALEPNF